MSEIVVIINTNGDRFDILKESVAAVMMRKDKRAIVFTTGSAITLGQVPESAEELRRKLMEDEEDG